MAHRNKFWLASLLVLVPVLLARAVGAMPQSGIVAWGDNGSGQCTVPALPSGLPTRSHQKGDDILVGQKRWYQVYYRDNTLLLPGCTLAASEFNATSAAEVTWLP